jgi:hypothetical protein
MRDELREAKDMHLIHIQQPLVSHLFFKVQTRPVSCFRARKTFSGGIGIRL